MAKKTYYPKYALSSLLSLGTGISQAVKGKRAMKDVQKQVDAGGLKYNVMGEAEKAAEGLSADTEKVMQEQAALQQAQGMGALSASGDARAMMGAMPGMVQQGNVAMREEAARRQGEQALMQEKQQAQAVDRSNLMQERESAQAMLGAGMQNIMGGVQGIESSAKMAFGAKHGNVMPENMYRVASEINPTPMININIGMPQPVQKKEDDAKSIVTPGEFNHDTNPIDIMDGDDKIGEATGGELIINKPDSKKLLELIESGDPGELRGFMKKLMVKIHKNSMENALVGAPIVFDMEEKDTESSEKNKGDEGCPDGFEKDKEGVCVPIKNKTETPNTGTGTETGTGTGTDTTGTDTTVTDTTVTDGQEGAVIKDDRDKGLLETSKFKRIAFLK